MHESLARRFEAHPEWIVAPEVSFSIYGERGVIDVLAYHPSRQALLVMELKTEIVDVSELLGQVDRYRRLAKIAAAERGWRVNHVGRWVIVADSMASRRRAAAHAALLRNAFPQRAPAARAWLRDPVGALSALTFLSSTHARTGRQPITPRKRVRTQ